MAVAKKAVAKKAVAKKAVAKKAVAKKAVAKKAVAKKAVAKKAVAKKTTAKKTTAKKTTAKKTTAKKTTAKKTTAKKTAVVKKTAVANVSAAPSLAALLPVQNDTARSGRSKRGVVLAAVILLGVGGAWIASTEGVFSKKDTEVSAGAETIAPTPQPVATVTPQPVATVTPQPVASTPQPVATATPQPVTTIAPKPVTASSTYTETGIRLSWKVKGIDVDSIGVSAAEDGKEFAEIETLASDIRFFDFIKTDTVGKTKFKVTVTSSGGETFSSTVQLRGRFTVLG